MNVGSLFAGIGGLELGLENAGFEISWQVEIDPFCREVLAEHFPRAQRFEDVCEVGAADLAPVDLLCGGFPCQDLSHAGRGAGIDAARSGLWAEFARLVRELRPGYVLVENVPGLLTGKGKRWDRAPIGRVLGDLAEARYDAEWACLSAREFGAPHLRRRVLLLAYPRDQLSDTECQGTGQLALCRGGRQGRQPAGPSQSALLRQEDGEGRPENAGTHRGDLADGDGLRREEGVLLGAGWPPRTGNPFGCGQHPGGGGAGSDWATEPSVGRVAHGVPDRVDRLAALGNAVVPQIADWIGRRILAHEAAMNTPEARPPAHHIARPPARQMARPPARRQGAAKPGIGPCSADPGAEKNLRSPRHTEAGS